MRATQVTGETSESAVPPRVRCKLETLTDCRREIAKLFREGRAGQRDVGDVSRLANVLQILARIIEGSDLERRIARLEAEHENFS